MGNLFCVLFSLVPATISGVFGIIIYSNIINGCVDCEQFKFNMWAICGVIPPLVFLLSYFITSHFESKHDVDNWSKKWNNKN